MAPLSRLHSSREIFRLVVGSKPVHSLYAWLSCLLLVCLCSGDLRAEPQSFRFWEDSTGSFRTLARMTGYEGKEVILELENGEELRVLRSRLGEEDVKYVDSTLAKHPELRLDRKPEVKPGRGPSGREARREVTQPVRLWEDASGEFSIRARMIDYTDGKVVLEKEDGEEIKIPKSSLSEVDRKYVDGILARRRDLRRDEGGDAAGLGAEFSASGRGAFQVVFTGLLVIGVLIALWGIVVFFRAAFENGEYWLLGVIFPPLALAFVYLHWELARPGVTWILVGLSTIVLSLLILGDDWARYLPSL